MIKILIADDHAIVRGGLKQIRATTGDIAVTAEAGQGSEVIEKLRTCAVDLLLLDMTMPGISGVDLSQGLVLNRASMLIDAAVDGQGIVLARTTLSAWDILNGRLVRPFATSLRLAKNYWIVCPQATAMLPKIRAARDWMLAEAASDARRLKALKASRA